MASLWTKEETENQVNTLLELGVLAEPAIIFSSQETTKLNTIKRQFGTEKSECCLFSVVGFLSVLEVTRLRSISQIWTKCGMSQSGYIEKLRKQFIFNVPLYSHDFAWFSLYSGKAWACTQDNEWLLPKTNLFLGK